MKKNVSLLFIMLYIMLGFSACNMDLNDSESNQELSDSELNEEPQYAKVVVDNLRMRDASGMSGTEITQIGKDQYVRLTGNQSDTTETIAIRGKSIPNYWYEIIFNGDTGWIYGGGMEILDAVDMSSGGGLNDFIIEPGIRAGLITKDATHESLLKEIGPEEVIKEKLDIGEGQTVNGTILYPNSDNEVLIYWENEDYETIKQLSISKPGSKWKTTQGIHIGQSIQEVNEINGKPFEMTGYEWDLAGTSLNWQGGKLNSNLTLKFDYNGDISVYPFLIGDKVISSNNSSLLKLDIRVRQIIVSFY